MPEFMVKTNVDGSCFTEEWMRKATDLIATMLGKPQQYVMIHALGSQNMTMGGTAEPCASIKLQSIGMISEEMNRSHILAITKFIEETLGISKNRMYVAFKDIPRDMIGLNGKLFK